jgi:hypothetical protein
MSRNNSERLNAGGDEAPPVDVTTPSGGSQPLSFAVPTEHVELPSKGKYYSENHPLYNKETIEIKFMTAKEEDILTSPSLVKKGLAIDRLLKSIIIEKNVDPNTLLIGDRNAILVASRITGYGSDYPIKASCPSCASTTSWNVDLESLDIMYGGVENAAGHNVTENENYTFDVTLPKTGVVVTVRLLTGVDEKELGIKIQKRKKHKLHEANLTEQLNMMIVAVNGSDNISDIRNFINVIPAFDSRYLRNAYSSIVPNVEMKQHFECEECAYEGDLEVPLTAEFFWPK